MIGLVAGMQGGRVYTIEVALEKSDLAKFGRYIAPRFVRMRARRTALIAVGTGALFALGTRNPGIGVAVAVGEFLVIELLNWWAARRSVFKTQVTSCEPTTVTISSDGVTNAASTTTTTRRWQAFRGVSERDETLMLFIGELGALLIPRRSVASDDDWAGLVRDVAQWRHAALVSA
jgi:YcxB-like protein